MTHPEPDTTAESQLADAQARIRELTARCAVMASALSILRAWKENCDRVRELAMETSLRYEPCGYYCDENVGHVDHKLFNAAKFLYGGGGEPDVWEKVSALSPDDAALGAMLTALLAEHEAMVGAFHHVLQDMDGLLSFRGTVDGDAIRAVETAEAAIRDAGLVR